MQEMLQKDFIIAVSKSDMLDDELKKTIEKNCQEKFRMYLFLLPQGKTTELKDLLWGKR